MTTVSVSEARAKLSQLLRRVLQGERVIITRQGVPIASLVPLEKEKSDNVDEVIEHIRQSRRGRTLGSLKIRDLIDEGRV